MSDRVAEIKARLAAASRGPWRWQGYYLTSGTDPEHPISGAILDDGSAGGEYTPAIDTDGPDAALIANAPTDIAWLVSEVERLRGRRE